VAASQQAQFGYDLYVRIGWATFERIQHNGVALTLMERSTTVATEEL
jgi:hypothetical protein